MGRQLRPVQFSDFAAFVFRNLVSFRVRYLIHDTRHLCRRSWIDGIKAMSRGISGGKQVIKFANTGNRGRVCLFYQNETTIFIVMRVFARFTSLLFAIRTSTVATA